MRYSALDRSLGRPYGSPRLDPASDGLAGGQSIDDLLAVLEVAGLGERFGMSQDSMRKRLRMAGGKVFKLGKKYVIRKVALLEVMEKLEHSVSG